MVTDEGVRAHPSSATSLAYEEPVAYAHGWEGRCGAVTVRKRAHRLSDGNGDKRVAQSSGSISTATSSLWSRPQNHAANRTHIAIIPAPGKRDVALRRDQIIGGVHIQPAHLGQYTDIHACEASAPISLGLPGGG